MTKIEQIERGRLYKKLREEIFAETTKTLDLSDSEPEADRLVSLGQTIDDIIKRYILASELSPTTSDDDSSITLTRRVVASLGMSHKLDGRKLDFEQCCQIIISIVTSLRDQQKNLKETLKKLNQEYNIQADWYLDIKGKKQEYQRNA